MDLDDTNAVMAAKVHNLQEAIRGDYRHNWIIDNLPAASLMETEVGFGCLGRGFGYVLKGSIRALREWQRRVPPQRLVQSASYYFGVAFALYFVHVVDCGFIWLGVLGKYVEVFCSRRYYVLPGGTTSTLEAVLATSVRGSC